MRSLLAIAALSGLLRRAALLVAFAWLVAPTPASAQGCWMGGVGNLAFGTMNIHANTDTSLGIGYTCQSNGSTTYFRTCMYLAQGAPIAGVNPRYMTNYNGAQMAWNLYTDAARSQIIGPPPSGGGYGSLSSAFTIAGGYVQSTRTATVYGRIPGNQSLPGGWNFQTQLGGSAIYWAWSNGAYPPSCTSGTGTGSATFYTQATANVPTSCRIAQVSNLDFGVVTSLAAAIDGTSQVIVRCPLGTAWNLGIGNGANAAGTTRRMRSSAGNFVTYELYRNAARSQRWGVTLGTNTVSGSGAGDNNPQTSTVYGRVPAQAATPGGSYADTVTITLTY